MRLHEATQLAESGPDLIVNDPEEILDYLGLDVVAR